MPPKAELTVKATPRAKVEKIEWQGEALRVWVRAAPSDGEANKAICALIARRLGVAKACVEVTRGESSRIKKIAVSGLSFEEAMAILKAEQRD